MAGFSAEGGGGLAGNPPWLGWGRAECYYLLRFWRRDSGADEGAGGARRRKGEHANVGGVNG